MSEQPNSSAREIAYEPEGYPACPFCGNEVTHSISAMLAEKHDLMEALCQADPNSEGYVEMVAELFSFVGGGPQVV